MRNLIKYDINKTSMANRQLVEYILSLDRRYPEEQIKNVLLEVGWSLRDVESAIAAAQQEAPASRTSLAVALAMVLIALAIIPFLPALSNPSGNLITEPHGIIIAEAAPLGTIRVIEEVETPAQLPSLPEPTPVALAPEDLPSPPNPPAANAPLTVPCEQLSGEDRDRCFLASAIQKDDHRLCQRIRDLGTLTNCVTTLAIKKTQPVLCQDLIFEDECLAHYSRATGDENACMRISSHEKRATCALP